MTPFSNDAKYVAKLQHVEQLIAGMQLPSAADQLRALLKIHPHDPRLFLLGSCLERAGNNISGALQLAQQVHQMAPDWAPGSIHLANALGSTGQADAALQLAEQAVQQSSSPADQADLLLQAATLANEFGNSEKTLQWLRQAQPLRPDDITIPYKIALTLNATGHAAEAVDILGQLLALRPANAALLRARFSAGLAAGQAQQALQDAQALAALEPDNPEFRFFLAYALGENPPLIPASLVAQQFDEYARRFDQLWVVQMKYQLPRDVAQMIQLWHPDKKVDVLDLGCGTGLLGACLGPLDGALVGVELSRQMISQAHRHGVYHRFHQVNLLDALEATPADEYHVITALDVLPYVGSLDSVMPGAWRILLPGGRFVFSVELNPQDSHDSTLHHTLRYSHRQSYLERLLKDAGFVDVAIDPCVLRQEAGLPVQALLVTACKPVPGTPVQLTEKPPAKAKSKKAAK